jgi:hypothetical protein
MFCYFCGMHKIIPFVILTAPFFYPDQSRGDETSVEIHSSTVSPSPTVPFKSFTGKITRNNVRLRLQPNLDGLIIKELNRHDKVIVVGENDDFYQVQPSPDFKGYVFRTFVLDGVIEGNRVNVRLEPSTEAPIIGQLNTGDKIEGRISPLNSKWLEIALPKNALFYICKEYVENIGDPSLMTLLLQRGDEVDTLLLNAKEQSGFEMQKPYEDISIQPLVDSLHNIINNYTDFPDSIAEAQELLDDVQETYLQKKLAYLEYKTNDLHHKLASGQENTKEVAQVSSPSIPILIDSNPSSSSPLPEKMAQWASVEEGIYQEWSKNHPNSTMEDFYAEQQRRSVVLKGLIEPYSRSIRNKPGDYILISKATQLPTAYLYSTQVDLETYIGKEATLRAVPRPNHNFAFPAYFVLSFE